MGNIDVNPAEVRKAAAKLRICAAKLNDSLRTFNQIEDEIGDAWKSKHTAHYLKSLETTEYNVEKTRKSINAVASNLNSIASAVEKAEDEIKNNMSGGGGSW